MDSQGPEPVTPAEVQRARKVPLHPLGRMRQRMVGLMGPAFVAAVAYVDPGNFATNVESGARFGFLLLWVVLCANVVAMLLQYLSAKLGIATGRNLPELCRDHYRRPVVWGLWLQAEIVVIMTDLAEFIGGAVALNLLFGIPLLQGGVLIAVASFVVLAIRTARQRRFEAAITGLLAVIVGAFLYQLLNADVPYGGLAGGLVPRFEGSASVLLAAGIVGATVMPHAVYLHSALTQERFADAPGLLRQTLIKAQRMDVILAMGVAGLVNMAMLVSAASILRGTDAEPTLHGAYAQFGESSGPLMALLFAIALLASGLASSSVGVYAGQVVMQGFLRRRIPLSLRRLIAVVPALAVLAFGVDPTQALVLSQVVLSFGIPFALIPLLLLTRRPDVMGAWVNRRATTLAAACATTVIVALNVVLVFLALPSL
ncbi:Nramp family divalent metal transporter [Sphaerisporangium sp. TRM90804]|uniref:Nramp family divalent metal transporter n=1 Tax=Sphaerisporangium sp. TRM90804 TaxID=3031113 RepID=UPI00244AD573|nr:Nramp family divalent metal transporter [Sphaerisporangium sp. TRM90804]MDH2424992.1 Nramp family divalent metal transporter [Sphaerisporangium sp. TRM90804]